MKSIFKVSLFAVAMTFAASNVAMAASAQHKNAHKHNKGHHYSKKTKKSKRQLQSQGDQATADLNARSLQAVQAENNAGNPSAVQDVNRYDGQGRRVIVAPGTGNTVAPPPAPGSVNPNNMPPVQ